MKQSPEMVRLVNNTTHLIHLPDCKVGDENIEGPRLGVGGNNVRADYVEALIARTDRPGELFVALLDAGDVKQDEREGATNLPEGPEPPKALGGYKPAAALALIDGMHRVEVLAAWLKKERRKPIAQAIGVKIAALGGSTAPAGLRREAARMEEDEPEDADGE